MNASDTKRLHVGAVTSPKSLLSITGEDVHIPDPSGLVHLQFRRFAGCPVCSLHLRSFVQRHQEVAAAGVREVVLFHSSANALRRYASDLPFAVVADPGKRLYREFGVESSLRALFHWRTLIPIARAVAFGIWGILRHRRPMPPLLRPEGGRFGLPADFLIDRDGIVRSCHYGIHADDQWSVDELLRLAQRFDTDAQPARAASAR